VRVEDGWLFIAVRDTGPGIPDEELGRIWEPFAQGGDRADGTGLGLAIARRFTELLGGGLTVESRAGEGSTFTVRIPYREVEADAG
jgi:signal transduction histidine kinase